MKAGKQVKIDIDSNFKTYYGSVDTRKPKSVFINISSWFSPLEENDNISAKRKGVQDTNRA